MEKDYPGKTQRAIEKTLAQGDEEIRRVRLVRDIEAPANRVPHDISGQCRRILGNDASNDAWDGGVAGEVVFDTNADATIVPGPDSDDDNESAEIIQDYGGGD